MRWNAEGAPLGAPYLRVSTVRGSLLVGILTRCSPVVADGAEVVAGDAADMAVSDVLLLVRDRSWRFGARDWEDDTPSTAAHHVR